jgi:hypothetical protein
LNDTVWLTFATLWDQLKLALGGLLTLTEQVAAADVAGVSSLTVRLTPYVPAEA